MWASDAKNAAGLPTSYNFEQEVCQSGRCFLITGNYDLNRGDLRTDIAVIDGSRGDFFITNEGTGTQVYLTDEQSAILDEFHTEFQDRGGNYAEYSNGIATAHADGWTGSSISIGLGASDTIYHNLIPNADLYVYDDDYDVTSIYSFTQNDDLYVTSFGSGSLEGYYIDELTEKSHAAVGVGVGLVWDKFDTLDSQQVIDLVEATSDGKRFDLGAALSPVGNIN